MNRIKELREAAKMTQAQLGAKIKVGNTAISMYESGSRQLDPDTICKLCDIFGCTADYLLGRSAAPSPQLTPEEESLLMAWRRCDDRARDMVIVALAPFASDESQSATG